MPYTPPPIIEEVPAPMIQAPVVVEPRVAPVSAFTPLPEEDVDAVADAIYKAEGGAKAKKPYGILSVTVKDEAEARQVAKNTIRNNWKRWHTAGKPGEYLEFLARKYAPVGAENDPKALNQNWLKNVSGLLKGRKLGEIEVTKRNTR